MNAITSKQNFGNTIIAQIADLVIICTIYAACVMRPRVIYAPSSLHLPGEGAVSSRRSSIPTAISN